MFTILDRALALQTIIPVIKVIIFAMPPLVTLLLLVREGKMLLKGDLHIKHLRSRLNDEISFTVQNAIGALTDEYP